MAAFLEDVRAAGIPVENCITTGSRLYRQNASRLGTEAQSFAAKGAEDTKENNSFTAKNAKAAKGAENWK